MPDSMTEAEVCALITFHLDWAQVDPNVDPFLIDLAPKEQWLQWERDGTDQGIFLHTVSAGSRSINAALARDMIPLPQRQEVVAEGLEVLALTPPYGNLPLYSAVLTRLAFTAQMRLDEPVQLADLPLRPDQVDPRYFLGSTEASFGFTLALLRAHHRGWTLGRD